MGWTSRNKSRLRSRWSFFFTLFIELIDLQKSETKAQAALTPVFVSYGLWSLILSHVRDFSHAGIQERVDAPMNADAMGSQSPKLADLSR